MQKAADLQAERRREPRSPAAFALWIDRDNRGEPVASWAVNLSVRGAALLVDAADAPVVGERLALRAMPIKNRWVAAHVPAVPRWGRVVRVESSEGLTRKFAICFEIEVTAPRNSRRRRVTNVGVSVPGEMCRVRVSRRDSPIARQTCPPLSFND